jgi:hypothetical protein
MNIDFTMIDIIEGIESDGATMLLSEIAEDITFIPLEVTDECLVRSDLIPLFHKDYIVVHDGYPNPIFLFDRTGKFIRKIGNRGQGPGEYIHSKNLIIVNDELFVYDVDTYKTLCYDLHTGKHLRTKRHDFDATPQGVWCFNDSVLVYYFSIPSTERNPQEFAHIHTLTLDFETTDKLWHEKFQSSLVEKEDRYTPPLDVQTYLKDGNRYIMDQNDEKEKGKVYYINKHFEKIPAYQISLGRDPKKKSYNILSMLDTDRFMFFWGETLPNHYSRTIIYDKTTQKSKYIISEFGFPWGFHNDIDGSIPLWMRWNTNLNQNVIWEVISPYKLKELMSHSYYKNIEIKNKEKHKAIKNYLASAKEDDNPIIFLVTLKTK